MYERVKFQKGAKTIRSICNGRAKQESFLTSRKEGKASLKASSSFSSSVLPSPCDLSLKRYNAASSSSFCRRLSSCSCQALTNRSRMWVKVMKRSGVTSPDCKACVFSSSREQLSNLENNTNTVHEASSAS